MSSLLERIWYREAPGWTRLLEPGLALASLCYAAGLKADQSGKRARAKSLPCPVLSVGNLTVGGTGKTPVTRWLADCCVEIGKIPCILTRGYGSQAAIPRRVDPETSSWREFGDEPVLLARLLKAGSVYAGHDRWTAGNLALKQESKIDLFILDDGFQHIELKRDVDIVLIDGERGFGNGHLLPHGPLREPVSALGRAQALGRVFRGDPTGEKRDDLPEGIDLEMDVVGWRLLGEREIYSIDLTPLPPSPAGRGGGVPPLLAGEGGRGVRLGGRGVRCVYLLSGIASPKGFESTVNSLGLTLVGHAAFRDHHPYTQEDVQKVRDLADQLGARVVTTAKDGIRLEEHLSVWTKEQLPVIIEVGLKHGDGTEYLTSILKRMFTRGRDS